MGPLPTRKTSRRKSAARQTHDSLSLKHLVRCESCGEYHVAHRMCPQCGTYKGKQVVKIEDDR